MSKILYVDMDNVLVDFPSTFPHLSPEVLREYEDRLNRHLHNTI
jgi:hypothetical protein